MKDKNHKNHGKKKKKKRNSRGYKLGHDRSKRGKSYVMNKIYEILIKPAIDARPPDYEYTDWLSRIFMTDSYPIRKYKVVRRFWVPGHEWTVNSDDGKRFADKNEYCWARFNKGDTIDLEIKVRPHMEYKTFQLSNQQWEDIKNCLKEINNDSDIS